MAFEIDADGILNVSAKDRGTGKEQRVEIRPSSGLTEDEIHRMVNDADRYREADAERRELIELRNTAEGLILTTERSLHEYVDLLTPVDVQDIRTDIQTLKETLQSVDPEEYAGDPELGAIRISYRRRNVRGCHN